MSDPSDREQRPADPAGSMDPDAKRTSERGDARQDLKATSDAIVDDISRLSAIENEKIALDAEDPKVDELSNQAIEVANRLSGETRAERALSEELG